MPGRASISASAPTSRARCSRSTRWPAPAATSSAARATSTKPPRGSPRSCPARRCRSSPTSTTSTAWRWPRWRPACTACASTPATSASPSTSRPSPPRRVTASVPIRIGVNGGSLDPSLYEKYGGITPEAMVESAQREMAYFHEVDFDLMQDLGQGVERAADGRGLPAAQRGHRPSRCTSASPRPARRRPGWSRPPPASPRC